MLPERVQLGHERVIVIRVHGGAPSRTRSRFPASEILSRACNWDSGDRGVNSHADVSVGVVKFHMGARLDPAHHPGLVARDWRHHNPCRRFEIGRLVPKHYGRALLDDRGAVVYGGGQVAHHDALSFDA